MILVAQTRFTGICGEAGQFDCGVLGENRCIPIKNFHDGKPNCPDESDECKSFHGVFKDN